MRVINMLNTLLEIDRKVSGLEKSQEEYSQKKKIYERIMQEENVILQEKFLAYKLRNICEKLGGVDKIIDYMTSNGTLNIEMVNTMAESYLISHRYNDAFKILKKALEKDDSLPLNKSIGDMYYYGLGVEKNYAMADMYYNEIPTVDKNVESIIKHVGDYYYYSGQLCESEYDEVRAKGEYEIAFSFGNIKAGVLLGKIYGEDNIERAKKSYQETINQAMNDERFRPDFDVEGMSLAFNALGVTLINDCDSSKDNYELAFEYFWRAWKFGDEEGAYHIGVMYRDGLGVEKSIREAMNWFSEAAYNGNEEAIVALENINDEKSK